MGNTGWDDDRGVSEVLGAILLFGIVIVALGSYQAFIVPQQNAEIELTHDAQVNDEFAEIQASISNAAATGTPRTTSITMGTRYPVRVAGLNPPTVSGKLATRNRGPIAASGFDDTDLETICGLAPETRVITYDAEYHELDDPGTLVYENGVTYRDVGQGILVRNQQELVDGSTIRLFPLTGDGFSTGSSSSKQVRFAPGETGTQTVDTEGDDLTLTFPSRLEASTWEDEILAERDDVTASKSGGEITLAFDPGTYEIQCTPVGIGSKPANQDPVPKERDDSGTNEVNPTGEGAVTYEKAVMNGSNGVTVTLRNRGDDAREMEEIRVPFYSADGQGSGGEVPEQVNVTGGDEPDVLVGGNYSSAPKTLQGNATGNVTITFFCEDSSEFEVGGGDFFAMNVLFENGDVYSYFINAPTDVSANNPC